MIRKIFSKKLWALLFWLGLACGISRAQTTAFTYQGKLTDGGALPNGAYDLQFGLYDETGSLLAVTNITGVQVTNGTFTVQLDFGAGAFPGGPRSLGIAVKHPGDASYTPLSPRQFVTSTPYAVRSLKATSADSIPVTGVPSGSGNYIQNTISQQASSNFNISGNGTAAGTLSGNIISATTQFNLGGFRVVSQPGPDSISVGISAGNNPGTLDNSFFGVQAGENTAVNGLNTAFGNSFFGHAAGQSNTTGVGNTALGAFAGPLAGNLTNATAIGYGAKVSTSNSLVLGQGAFVGIGTTAPVSHLHLHGAAPNMALTFTNDANTAGRRGYRIAFDNDRLSFQRATDTGAFLATHIIIDQASGNVGIGPGVPDQTLTVTLGTASKPGGGSWAIYSDERLKNVKSGFTRGLKAVMQLQPIRYEYKSNNALDIKSEGDHIGFSAQAVQKIIPEAVMKNGKGYLLIDNDPILWTMLNALKEQQAQIERQQGQIDQLKQMLTARRTAKAKTMTRRRRY